VLPYPYHAGMSRVLVEACSVGTPGVAHHSGSSGISFAPTAPASPWTAPTWRPRRAARGTLDADKTPAQPAGDEAARGEGPLPSDAARAQRRATADPARSHHRW
jgi:hypothetical protein